MAEEEEAMAAQSAQAAAQAFAFVQMMAAGAYDEGEEWDGDNAPSG